MGPPGPGGALRFLGTSKSDFADFVIFLKVFVQVLTVFRHVEVCLRRSRILTFSRA